MNKFVSSLKKENNKVLTENGAKTYASSLDACVDLFFKIGATPWPKLKKAIWDVVTSARINEPRYVDAYDLTDKLYAAVRAAPSSQAQEDGR